MTDRGKILLWQQAGGTAVKVAMLFVMLTTVSQLMAQKERKIIREGIRSYEKGDFSEAEVQFRKAVDLNHESYEADFNTGAALYGQEKYKESVEKYKEVIEKKADEDGDAGAWHNLGNSLLESQQYAESIEAYKNSLRINPLDEDSRYNLAYAKQKLQEQQQQQQDQQNQDQQDQQQQDQQDQQNQDQQDQQQQASPMEISKEDAERMLNAIQQQEKDVKEKVDKNKAAAAKIKTDKDW